MVRMAGPMTLRELAELGHLLGHSATDIEPTASGRRFTVGCSCGITFTTRATEAEALRTIVHHLQKQVRAYAATGRPLPDIPLPGANRDTPRRRPAAEPAPRAVRSVS